MESGRGLLSAPSSLSGLITPVLSKKNKSAGLLDLGLEAWAVLAVNAATRRTAHTARLEANAVELETARALAVASFP